MLRDGFLQEKINEAVLQGAAAMMKLMSGPMQCVPGASAVQSRVMDAARAAGSAISNLIPNLGLRWDFKGFQILKPQKLFCEEVWTTPRFNEAPCAADLGCKSGGTEPEPEEEVEASHGPNS